ncbi:MAG: hypothetical protein IJJ01_11675 [Firmicutes bacterium]|nr:hypothetical protein [Bacillota bacterium]
MKRIREYTIYTLDARNLMKYCKRRDRCFDFTSEYDRSLIVESVKTYSESALFYQIREAERSAGGSDSPDAVTSRLVYLHFENGVEGVEEETKELLEKGVKLRFKGDKDYHTFIPFDKSASMARENVISFISEDVFDAVNESLNLGIDWCKLEIEASKYYAYRGLYMTDGVEIPLSSMELNEETVIVLGIETMSVHDKAIAVRYADPENRIKYNPDEPIKISPEMIREIDYSTGFTSVPYDGEGIVCPEYAKYINKTAVEDKQQEATSFQIRMPYTKGMLHTVDFLKFLREQFPDTDIDQLELEDCFGIRRKIADAKIILTKSMFKCADWLKEYFSEGVGDSVKYSDDPMRYYFEAFRRYGHAMYLVSSDANFRSDDCVKLNYQFLNTLDMDRRAFSELVERHIADTRLITIDPNKGRSAILRSDDSEIEKILESGDPELARMDSWEYALRKNVAFINDPMIKKMIQQVQESQTRDIRRGRLIVPGTIKYLSGDLLYFLTIIAEKCGLHDENDDKDRIEYLRKYRILYPDRCYIAGRKKYKLNNKKFYGILRSPHLSRNEQCALRPVKLQIYNKYFSHLKGIVMVSDKSSVPAALGGADFDGDTVKIIRDEEINQVIFDSVYEKEYVTFETEEGPVERLVNMRKLPVVTIDPPEYSKKYIGEKITFEDLRRVFSSEVGIISNMALTIGKLEYGKSTETKIPEGSTALCTIATGLEIDSVKTGIKPDTSELAKLTMEAEDKYLDVKRAFDRISKDTNERDKVVHGRVNSKTGEYEAYFQYRNRAQKTKTIFKISEEQSNNIDLLPFYYVKELAEKKTSSGKQVESQITYALPAYRFRFESDENWEEKTAEDPRIPSLMKIIGSYRKIILDAWNFSRTRERTKAESLRGSVMTLLYTEYDKDMDRLYKSDASLDDALETAYEILYDAMPQNKDVEDALEKMRESGWQFVRTFEEKEAILREIIGQKDVPLKAAEILCDTYDNGYQYLNYMLRDTGLFRQAEESEAGEKDEKVPELKDIPKGKWKKEYDPDLYRKLHADYRRTPENRSVWMRRAANSCRNAVYDLFDGDIAAAIRCTLILDGTYSAFSGNNVYDENHTFLWDVYNAEDMSNVIYAEQEEETADAE